MEDTDNCAICLESLVAEGRGRQRLGCGHFFHELCVLQMRRYGVSDRCPLCCSACSDLRSVEDLMHQAFLCNSRRQFAEEKKLLDEVLTVEPSNGLAMMGLGVIFQIGKGIDRNFGAAVQLFEEARRAGVVRAACNLGVMYRDGEGVEKNITKARELYEEARRAGLAEAACNLAIMYKRGEGVEKNITKARELWEEARRGGVAQAAFSLAIMYQDGEGVEKNIMKARELYEEARRGGHFRAAYNLAIMYQDGEGVEKNITKARELYEEARRGGFAQAAYNLGSMYRFGEGVEKNTTKARELYEEARRGGIAEAACNLAIMYRLGEGVEKNTTKARELFEEARRGGDAPAACNLGVMYQHGEGVEKNTTKARDLYGEARRAGVPQAAHQLGLLYLEGQGVPKDVEKAKVLFEEALHGGDARAAHLLALLRDVDTEKGADEGNTDENLGQIPTCASTPRPARPSCATCGAEGKGLKLCTGCRRTWYCSVHCQRQHRDAHKEVCKQSPPQPMPPPQPCEPVAAVSEPAPATARPPSPDLSPWRSQAPDDYEAAAAASLDEVDAHAAAENGQIAEAILRSRSAASAVRAVILLEFSRDPRPFHDALRGCDELMSIRDALKNAGAASELPSLTKVFVPPEMYDAVLEAVRIFGLELHGRHVLVAPELEETVKRVAHIPGSKVRPTGRGIVPLGFAEAALQADAKIEVTHTFVHISIPRSLCSEVHSGPVTASTTDAHPRSGQNPRAP